jgi:hypothetical protein
MSSLKAYDLRELAGLQEDMSRWIIPNGIQSASRVIVYGQGNVGKSWIFVDLAISVAMGDDFLGLTKVMRQGPVLVCSTEGDIYTNKDRVFWLANGHALTEELYDKTPFYFMQDAPLLDVPESQAEFRSIVEQLKPTLIILDPLDSFFSGEENSATQTKPVRRFIDGIVRDYGACVMMLHHESAQNDKGSFRRPRGTTAWQGWADTIIHARAEPGKAVALDVEKQRNGRTGFLISVAIEVNEARKIVRFRSTHKGDNVAEMVDQLLEARNVPMAARGICDILHRSASTILDALERLERLGRVERCDLTIKSGDKVRVVEGWSRIPGSADLLKEQPDDMH